ncbi:MAG TPA: ribonuclease HI family protein [Desulfobulbus sp.]|nr:ribonuclease HI family protein [Desulfobulbus sp.]
MDRQAIIRRLADTLTDRELEKIFPEIPPDDIRNILLQRKKDCTSQKIPPDNGHDKHKLHTCALYTDGASRGNPGQAGAGAVILDENGRELAARAEYLGICTNNVAEYKALISGLRMAVEVGCAELNIFLDSELIVRQLTGRYKVKNATLKPLFQQVQQLLQRLAAFSITHVPRAKTRRADELANQGIDERMSND